ncbi:MAG TPA: hypothetical protein VII41_09400, partial [Steroidobacteraceae bacterium]
LTQAEAEVTRLQAQVNRLEGQLAASTNARHETQAPTSAAVASLPAAAEEAPAPGGMFASAAESAPRRAWPWALVAGIAGLAAGFALGWRILDRNIRRKYGGLRIY